MSKYRKLQRLLALAQKDLNTVRPKTLEKYKRDLADWFPFPAAKSCDIPMLQDNLKDVVKQLHQWKQTGTLKGLRFCTEIESMGNILTIGESYPEHLRKIFIECLDDLMMEELLICPQCGNLFVRVGKTKKTYCTSRCSTEANRGE